MAKILMVEDDLEITELLEQYLSSYSIETLSVTLPLLAIEKLEGESFDLVLLDLGLPQMDGLELCKIIKQKYPQTPVIISTARADVSDKVIAFELGADDYIAKPYEPRELVARIQAHIKRYQNFKIKKEESEFVVDRVKLTIEQNSITLDLTLAEFEIFAILLEKKHQVVSREFIINSIDSISWESSDRSIDVIVSRIRHKIGDNPKEPKYIKSVRGIGYKYIGE